MIRKYLSFRYFSHLYSQKEPAISIANLNKSFSKFRSSYNFTAPEVIKLNQLENRLKQFSQSFTVSFYNETIESINYQKLNQNEKLILFKGNKLLYFWASWCSPCREFLNEIKGDEFIYKGEKYSMIFISIDDDKNKWKTSQFPYFTSMNSFRVVNADLSKFLNIFQIKDAIPRMISIVDGKLSELNVDKKHIHRFK